MTRFVVIGEALIDLIVREKADGTFDASKGTEVVGGSPLNVAAGVSQLGYPTELATWFAQDDRAQRIKEVAAAQNVAIIPGSDEATRTTVATAILDSEGRARYEFDVDWNIPEIPDPAGVGHMHIGSYGATLEPGATRVLRAVKRQAINGTVSYDPNARSDLMESPEKVVERIEELIALSDVVKASDEDIEWLYPDTPVEKVIRDWIKLGPSMVIVTRGPWGAYVKLENERDMLVVDPLNVALADTVGAGDSFMAGLLAGLTKLGYLGSPEAKARLREAKFADVLTALHQAVITAGLTVSHDGAYAPSPAEVADVITADPRLA
ncbi:carbohydrate kinase [Actinotignum urinale]|uniref:carbohydrate kinase family protein n=1 Tax=Actinotignum urinale TaxID=190146 RepID=UPI002A83ED28|nr:carbohydrate kinase [Actinotignum urinale]MDY5151456.1 carbohydrate kinase [Actinotignum urinale]